MQTEYKFTGLKETLDAFKVFQDEVGDKTARSKILIPAVKMAMKPVLFDAKIRASSNESHMLENSLVITGRRPTAKDKRSQYVTTTDSVIAFVITKPIPRAVKKKFHSEYTASGNSMSDKVKYRKEAQKFYESKGIYYDARAIANEYGTANRPAKPFMRMSLENNVIDVTDLLRMTLDQKMREFAQKTYNKTQKG
jgi:hypothetical protein